MIALLRGEKEWWTDRSMKVTNKNKQWPSRIAV
jgi:hypothetical protein